MQTTIATVIISLVIAPTLAFSNISANSITSQQSSQSVSASQDQSQEQDGQNQDQTQECVIINGQYECTQDQSQDQNQDQDQSEDEDDDDATPSEKPTVLLTSDKSSVNTGEQANLTWNSTNADTCSASGDWSGTKNPNGTQTTGFLNQVKTYNYRLTCTGPGGVSNPSEVNIVVGNLPAVAGEASQVRVKVIWKEYGQDQKVELYTFFSRLLPA